MEYLVTLHLKSGLEIEYIQTLEIKNASLDTARKFVEHELALSDIWMKLDDDATVKRTEVDYFKIKELEEVEEELEGKAVEAVYQQLPIDDEK
ncbi:hypothetical protein P4159_05630 [Bacillus thuringiensis]|uniref:hypothetical protein n=1 Tax=Bacillus cereus group TaxID=86661 RepID=UPI000CD85A1F|nr:MULTISPECIES: hypothetical protein [Bacillus cereus group]MEC3420518.1 hypothetical protein [Bacillus cereus]MEC3596928.1 hypothetical protein [Bacillus thuringiensis]MED1574277.1 hypothetical protein [Bacillus paranthracis]MED1836201.1 hypothetical protein [Bacillus thuringiensis]MED2670264.1 hypothetical protein [Bacillus thuringiensis]